MLHYDPTDTQYDLRLELRVFDSAYIEVDEIKKPIDHRSVLNIIQLNIRGLVNKQDQLGRLIENTKTDVVLLCETWLNSTKETLINIESHKLTNKNRKDRIGGGVSILVDKSLRSRARPDLIIDTDILEHVVVELKTDKRNILLVSGYRPPNTNVRKFLREYKELLQSLGKHKDHELIIGLDHNLNLLQSHQHSQTNEFLELNLKRNLLPAISKPTRITNKTATLIDNIMLSTKLQYQMESHILIDDMSDHLPCLVTLENQKKCKKGGKTITSRDLNEKNIAKIKEDIYNIDWLQVLTDDSVDRNFTTFHQKLTETIEQYAPEIEKRISAKNIIRDPWITRGLLTSLKKQQRLYKHTLVVKTSDAKNKYNHYRNLLKKLIRRSKYKYLHDKCTEYRQDSRKLWTLINKIIGKENNKTHVIESIKSANIPRTDPYTITNTFNEFFSTVGKTYAERHIVTPTETSLNIGNIDNNPKTLFLHPCTTLEIEKIIKQLPNKSSSGHNNISNVLLKKLAGCLTHPLSIIFNQSMESGKFPEAMKKADEKGPMLLTMSKLLEKVMYVRTYNFLTNTDQFYTSQYGFRQGHSCENAVSELVAEIIKSKQEGLYTLSMFLDLSKAFDTLDHEVLIRKLEKYGIRGKANKWFKDYLTNRKMRTKCVVASTGKMEYSEYQDITYRTPQGSCLGPLIFIIFTNDLHKQLQHSKSLLFADDTTLYKSHRNLNYLTWCIEDDMSRLTDWFRINKLTLNLDKTVCILFQKSKEIKHIVIKIGRQTIKNTVGTKFLGLWIDEHLSWNTHIQKLHLKLTRNTNLLKLNQNMMPTITKTLIYHSHIGSHLQYGLLLWGNNATEEQLLKLQKIQTKCLKYILPKEKTLNLHHILGILTIKDLIQLANWKFGYKLSHNLLPTKTTSICLEDSKKSSLLPKHHYNTRNKGIPNLPNTANKSYRDSFLLRGPRSILSLDKEIQNSPNLTIFTLRCKKLLIKNQTK